MAFFAHSHWASEVIAVEPQGCMTWWFVGRSVPYVAPLKLLKFSGGFHCSRYIKVKLLAGDLRTDVVDPKSPSKVL